MLKFKMAKVNFFYFILILFFSTNGLANEFYKCPEKVTEVYKGQSQYINEGSIIGTNYINIRNSYITIKFKELGSSIRATKIIFNKKLNRNSLGYEIFEKYSENGLTRENTYNFIKIDNSYAFTRKEYYWSPNSQSQKKNYEYESSGRCLKISENEYKKERVIKVAKKEVKKIIKKKKESQNNSKIIKGERSIAMNWQGYDDLKNKKKITVPSITNYFILFADLKNKLINKEIIQTLKKHNTKEKFFFSSIKPNYTRYEEKRYWRGPVWINCNWIIYQGLKDKDKKFAQMVRSKTIDLVKKNGFYEYFNTMTGKAYGAKNFSWTASLFLDLILDKKKSN